MSHGPDTERRWTVPNVICGLRLVGLIPLLWLAHEGHRRGFLWLLVALLLSDWIDGKLATLLKQRSTFGARLDSAVDAVMYLAIALSFWWFEEETIRREILWFAGVAVTWLVSVVTALARFRRLPSYHTRAAKVSWLVAGVVAVTWLLRSDAWAVPGALALVMLTNLEAVAIGLVLPEWRADVRTVIEAWRIRRRHRGREGSGEPPSTE